MLVAINQPFTLWMLHSFFLSIPKDLDESAMVDGCSRFQAFRMVVIPVMWPGVITTGLFSFLLAYNDFAVTAMLLSQDEPDDGAEDRELPRHDAGRRAMSCTRSPPSYRPSLPLFLLGHLLPETDRQRPDRRRSQGIMPWPKSA